MTFRKKLMLEHPEKVDSRFIGGCKCCPGDYWPGEKKIFRDCNKMGPTFCSACWDREVPEVVLPYDLNALIDNCMAKKDRYVEIFTSAVGTTVTIHPIVEEKEEEDDNNE